MYKPPQNSNRVKSIKSKFENIENNAKLPESNIVKNGHRNNLNSSSKKSENLIQSASPNKHNVLSRQLSDPQKRNIKRTPAFRLDRNSERNSGFQRNIYNRSTLFEDKVKQFSSALKNCDNNSNIIKESASNNMCVNNDKNQISPSCSDTKSKPVLIKSKSSHDFQYIRSKFNGSPINHDKKTADIKDKENQSDKDLLKDVDFSLLYTEPIPKSLRVKNISDSPVTINFECSEPQFDNIYTVSTLKLLEKPIQKETEEIIISGLTDTLKTALKKPLPAGPAPQKPPRTFQHCVEKVIGNDLEKNISFLHVTKEVEKKLNIKPKTATTKKADAKYMLNKLETALRNNKLRARRQVKADISTTSGEDSDDSLLFRSKSNRSLPKLPKNNTEANFSDAFGDFNCFNGISCTNPAYEKIKEPNSSFFIGSRSNEPVYAEPYHYRRECTDADLKKGERESSKICRNSLYYLSTPVLNEEKVDVNMDNRPKQEMETKLQELKLLTNLNRQISAENSSLSSFTSDLDSTPSPMDDPHSKIKCLIDTFETRNQNTRTNDFESIYANIDNTTRVENLKNTLRRTLDRSFDRECAMRESIDEHSDESKVADIITKFQTYIKSVPKYCQPKIHKDTLFYCCLIIEKVKDCAQIKFKFPAKVEVPHNIESLCFPERDSVPVDATNTAQSYSLVITNDKGERTFGYCRRVLPEGSTHCLPLAYCILSKYRAPRFYKKILIELESRHGIKNKFRDELINQFYTQKFPQPGESIKINLSTIEPKLHKTDSRQALDEEVDLSTFVHVNKTGEYGSINRLKKKVDNIFVSECDIKTSCVAPSYVEHNGENMELVLTLHPDTRYEDADLKVLHKLSTDILLKIFSSLLLERKVILISSVISDLSSCIDSLQSILFPFMWHHTFIPILPESLWDIVESPTPVICGVLSTEVVDNHKIENGIVVNLENNSVLVEEGDENKILSGSMQKVWKKSIAVANKAAASMDYVHSVYLANAYLQVFIMCFKNYKNYISNGQFQKEEFIKNAKTKGIRRFLKMFTETYMFHAFMDSVLGNQESSVAFDKKIAMYGSDESSILLDKLLEWNR